MRRLSVTTATTAGRTAIGRRRFLRAAPAAVAAGFALPAAAQQAQQESANVIARGALDCAEQIIGLGFTQAEQDMMLRGVNRNLESYASLLEALAFQPAVALAPLIETRKITSTDLTRMYLARLKRYGDTLKCVVTLTEDLALAQAAKADREIEATGFRLRGEPPDGRRAVATAPASAPHPVSPTKLYGGHGPVRLAAKPREPTARASRSTADRKRAAAPVGTRHAQSIGRRAP